jgi:hypothetical protein
LRPLGLGHDPAAAAPGPVRHPPRFLNRRSGLPVRRLFAAARSSAVLILAEPLVLGQAKEKVHTLGFVPSLEVLPRETVVSATEYASAANERGSVRRCAPPPRPRRPPRPCPRAAASRPADDGRRTLTPVLDKLYF